jgi:hypothetical protein
VYDAGPILPHRTMPKLQPVPVNRLALASFLLTLVSAAAAPFCLGLAGSAAAIVMAHRAKGQLQPADVIGARMVLLALLVGYTT